MLFRRPFFSRRRFFGILAVAAGLLAIAALAGFLFPQEILTVDSGNMKGDAIVVLGGGLKGRPERAAELFARGIAPKIVVSGYGDCTAHELLLEKNGVPKTAIIGESASRNTFENAKFSVSLLRKLGAKRVIIVTSWYHSRRALRCFEHAAPDMLFFSRPSYVAISRKDWTRRAKRQIFSEYIKLPGYWIRYGICPL